METSPNYLVHKGWVDSLVTTPSPCKNLHGLQSVLLMSSPTNSEHVLRGTKSFAIRSYRSRPAADSTTFRVPSDSSNKENESAANKGNAIPPQTASSHLLPLPVKDNHDSTGSVNAPSQLPLSAVTFNGQTIRSAPFYRRSPTPSLRKKRAEAIVKAHGSPTHVRVTAGGRIVPKEQSPLCLPRYGYSAVKVNNGLIKFAPNHPVGKIQQWTQATSTTSDGMLAQDQEGRLCQIISGQILPLVEIDGTLRLHMPAPNLNVTQAAPPFLQPWQHRSQSGNYLGNANANAAATATGQNVHSGDEGPSAPDPPILQQLNALELEYAKLEHELRDLDKSEVIHGRTMSKVAKDALVGKRRELVTTMDRVRKAIKGLRDQPQHNSSAPGLDNARESPPASRLPSFLRTYSQGQPGQINLPQQGLPYSLPWPAPEVQHQPFEGIGPYGFNPIMPTPGMFVQPPPLDGSVPSPFLTFGSTYNQVLPQQAVWNTRQNNDATSRSEFLPQSDGSLSKKHSPELKSLTSPRHSNALPIKAPEYAQPVVPKTRLNPKSPEYTPRKDKESQAPKLDLPGSSAADDELRMALSPLPATEIKPGKKKSDTTSGAIGSERKHIQPAKSSASSYDTADFFPRDTQEYSTRKAIYGYDLESKSSEKENLDPEARHTSRATTPACNSRPRSVLGKIVTRDSSTAQAVKPSPGTPVQSATISQDQRQIAHEMAVSLQCRENITSQADVCEDHTTGAKEDNADAIFVETKSDIFACKEHSPSQYYECEDGIGSGIKRNAVGIDLSEKSKDWLLGFNAGLYRHQISPDRDGDFLNGYCHGLLRSKPGPGQAEQGQDVSAAAKTPTKFTSRRPSPTGTAASRGSSRLQSERRQATVPCPPLENAEKSRDTFKQVVLAPSNEHAILTPALDGPHVGEVPFRHVDYKRPSNISQDSSVTEMLMQSLRAGDGNAGFPFPDAGGSVKDNQSIDTNNTGIDPLEGRPQKQRRNKGDGPGSRHAPTVAGQILQGNKIVAGQHPLSKARDVQVPTRSANAANNDPKLNSRGTSGFPPYRMFSPQPDMRSITSIGNAGGLASGTFVPPMHPQMDGVSHSSVYNSNRHRQQAPHSTAGGRFKEASSLDGVSGPSPPPMTFVSPLGSPRSQTPADETRHKGGAKSPSPAKQKFEQLAGIVGITRERGSSTPAGDGSDQTSPQQPSASKRRWRDLWKGSRGA